MIGQPVRSKRAVVIALEGEVLLPGQLQLLSFGYARALADLTSALSNEEPPVFVCGRPAHGYRRPAAFCEVGTEARLFGLFEAEKEVLLLVRGRTRMKLSEWTEQSDGTIRARVKPLPMQTCDGTEMLALQSTITGLTEELAASTRDSFWSERLFDDELETTAYRIAAYLDLEPTRAQALLELVSQRDVLRLLYSELARELSEASSIPRREPSLEPEMTWARQV